MGFMTCSLVAMEDYTHEKPRQEELLTDYEAAHLFLEHFNNGVKSYKPLKDALALRPRTIQETVTLLYGVLGSLQFYSPKEISFNNKSIAIYSHTENAWLTLADTGANPLYELFNLSVGAICVSNEDVKALIALARKQFWQENKNKVTKHLDLLEELPAPVKQRILQRYIWNDLDEQYKHANEVRIETKLKYAGDYKVGDTTTVAYLKEKVLNREGIPVDQQSLCALRKANKWTLWIGSELSEPLEDDRFVKEVMNSFKTDIFLLTLHLRRPAQTGN